MCTFFSLHIVIMIVGKNELMTQREKQQIWRNKQIQLFYGSGRPLFKISEKNQFERKNYDNEYYFHVYGCKDLDNKNYLPNKNNM